MSDTTGVKVNISADASAYTEPVERAKVSAQSFSDALRAVGGDLRKITPEMLGVGQATDKMSEAIFRATAGAEQASVTFSSFSTSGLVANNAFKSAAESADFFLKSLNPTPLQTLRKLMAEDVPAAVVIMRTDFQGIINASVGVGSAFKSAADSADVFLKALNPTPLQSLRSLMANDVPAAAVTLGTNFKAIIEATTGVGIAFKSAQQSADVFNREISRMTMSELRRTLSEDIPAAAKETTANFQAIINSAVGIDRSFKSAQESAATFNRALDPTPLQQIRALMATDLPEAARNTTANLEATISATFGIGRQFKSAAESADVFSREINRIPLAQLRTSLRDVEATGKVTWTTLQEGINAANGIGTALHSAADSARVFQQALDPTPLQTMRKLMATDVPQAAHTSAAAMSGLSREFIVIGHEAMSGNWSRIPGSLLVLTEYTGGARDAVVRFATSFGAVGIAAGVSAAAVVAGLGLMIARAYEAKRALDEVTAAAALMGRSTVEAANSAKAIRESLQDAGMGRSDIDKVNAAIARTPGMTDETRRAFGMLAPAMQAAFPGEDVEKYFTPLMHAAAGGANSVKSYLEQIDGLNASNLKALDTAEAQNDKQAANAILLSVMKARLAGYNTELERRKQILADVNVPGLDAPPLTMGMLPRIRLPQSTQPEAAAESPETIRQAEAQEKLLAPMRERAALQRDINDLQTAIAKGGDAADLANQQEALRIAQAKLQLLRDAGDSTWAAKQQGALNDILVGLATHATSAKQLAQDENQARITFWEQAAKEANLTESQITLARAHASRARLALAGEEMRTLDAGQQTFVQQQQEALGNILTAVAAHSTSRKQLAMDENKARIAFWDEQAQRSGLTERQISAAHIEAARARVALAGEELRALDDGQKTYVQEQQVALGKVLADATAHATSRKQLALEETRARIKFWDEQAEKAGATERQIAAAQIEADRARQKLAKQELAENEAGAATWVAKQQEALSEILVGVAAHAKSSRGLAEDENRARIAFWEDAAKHSDLTEKEITAAKAEANRARLALAGEEMRGGEAAAKQALGAKLSALSAEQAANHDNFAKVMELEDQKVALLRAAGAEETKQLNEELKAQINMRRQHTLQVIAEQERELGYSRGQHTAEIAEKRAELDEEVSERRMSKAEEMGLLRAFADEKHALDLQALDQLLATIDPTTEAWRKLYADIGKIKQQWLAQDRRLNAEATADLKRQWDKATAPVSQAIDSQVSAMLRGTQTIGQSVAGMAQNIVADYAKLGVKTAMEYASSQLMILALGRSAETAKTGITASGAAARQGISASETAGENAGLVVRLGRWIATQLGMTTSAAAGAATREGVLTAEQLASIQATGAAARLSIAAAAAVAAAWAFADSAELGPVGLAAAPAAAAEAEMAVMAFQLAVPSLDVGAWNVPKDMGANLHAGEMVVPANFASGLRGSINGGKGGDMNLNYSPTVNGGGTDMNSLMRNQAGMIKNYLWHATRNGALRLPGR